MVRKRRLTKSKMSVAVDLQVICGVCHRVDCERYSTCQVRPNQQALTDLYADVYKKPALFGLVNGRFALMSDEADEDVLVVYIHYNVFAHDSVVLKTWMLAEYTASQEGRPYKIDCSSAALHAFVAMVYLHKHPPPELLHECLCSANELQMCILKKLFADQMIVTVVFYAKQRLQTIQDFDLLLQWLHCAAVFKLDNHEMTFIINLLGHMQTLAQCAEQQEVLRAEVQQYFRTLGYPEYTASFYTHVYLNNTGTSKKAGVCCCGQPGHERRIEYQQN